MKTLGIYLAGLLLTLFAQTARANNVSISVGQPGFYGHINIGGYPAPRLIHSQPVYVQPAPYGAAPMYIHAPPKHVKHWHKHCHRYGACGAPVYFVQDRWYESVYVPEYRHRHGHKHHHRQHGHNKHHHHRHRHHDD